MAHNDDAIRLLNELYQHFVDIGYVETKDISWPPHAEGNLNESACRKHGLSEAAIDFLKHIPLSTDKSMRPIVERACSLDWSSAYHIEASRHPEIGHSYDPDDPLSDDKCLDMPRNLVTIAMTYFDPPGRILAVDVDTGAVITWTSDDTWEYATTVSANEYLGNLLASYRSLDKIPWGIEVLTPELDYRGNVYTRTRTMLLEYGWPNEFRRGDFVRDYTDQLRRTWESEKFREEDCIKQELLREHGSSSETFRDTSGEVQIQRAKQRMADREAVLMFQRLRTANENTTP